MHALIQFSVVEREGGKMNVAVESLYSEKERIIVELEIIILPIYLIIKLIN